MIKSMWIVHCIGAGLKLLKPDKEWAGVGLSGMGIKSIRKVASVGSLFLHPHMKNKK